MPRRGRFSYQKYVQGLLDASRSAPVRRQRDEREPGVRRGVDFRGERSDPVLLRQLIVEEKRAESSTQQAIFGHKLKGVEAKQKHQFRLQEEVFKSDLQMRRDALSRMLDKESSDAEIRSKESLIKLREAQTRDIISKPAQAEWEAMIDKLQEGQKQEGRLQLKVLEHKQKIDLEEFKAQNKGRLEVLKQSLKPPTKPPETVFEQLERLKATGAIRTVGDVAKFWFGRGKKREDIETLSKMEMRSAGIPFEQVFEQEAGFIESAEDKQRAWQKLLQTPLVRQEASQEATSLTKQFPSRATAERFLRDRIRELRVSGEDEEKLQADVNAWLTSIGETFPDQPSVFHQLIAEPDPNFEPSRAEVFDRMKKDLKAGVKSIIRTSKTQSDFDKKLGNFFRGEAFGAGTDASGGQALSIPELVAGPEDERKQEKTDAEKDLEEAVSAGLRGDLLRTLIQRVAEAEE